MNKERFENLVRISPEIYDSKKVLIKTCPQIP